MKTMTKTKELTTLIRPIWLDAAGMNKGTDHDRQHLDIILAAGQVMQIRQINPKFKDNLKLRLLNDDSNTETLIEVGNNWVEIKSSVVSVPFIDTPYNRIMPKVEFQYSENTKTLPVYCRGGNKDAFFDLWERQQAEFALIESQYAIILVPVISKNKLHAMEEGKDIDGLIDYYDSIFTFYNALVGLSFEPQRPTDLNPPDRYFIKADKHGAGAAYYTNTWTAESTASISSFWLTPQANNWGPLHEIGHGYEGRFMQDKYFSVSEVWNNIYAGCYQSVMLGDRKYKESWVYNYGKQEQVEKGISDHIRTGKPVMSWDLRYKLYFILGMIEKAGMNAFTHFNQQYRLIANNANFIAEDHALLDMLSESFANAGQLVDVTPYIQLVGAYLTPVQCERNLYSQAKAVYPLNQLVQGQELISLQQQLKLASSLHLVDVQQLQASGLKGDVTLQLNIDNLNQLYGKTITLLDGSRIMRQVIITSPEIVVRELPIGVYTLRLPTGKDRKYQPDGYYLVVKPGQNQQQINFVYKPSSRLVTQKINLLGLANKLVATVLLDYVSSSVTVSVATTTPHSYFPNQIYAQVVIKNQKGAELFNKTIPGTNATISHDEIPFTIGDSLEIYHEEPKNRVYITPFFAGVLDNQSKSNLFQITASGLKNTKLNNDPQDALLARIESAATILRSHYVMLHAECATKDDIWLAINLFDSQMRKILIEKYADCLPAANVAPNDKIGNAFTFLFNGYSDIQFLDIRLDLFNKQLVITLAAGVPHSYFNNEIYTTLRYLSADGHELLNLNIIGSEQQQAQRWVLPISGYGGEVLQLRHEEFRDRLIITNDTQQQRITVQSNFTNYRVMPGKLEEI